MQPERPRRDQVADRDAALRLYAESGYALVNGYCSLMLPLGPEPR